MKKLTLLVAAMTLLVGCQSNTYDNTLDKVLEEGKLVVSTSPDFPPMEFLDQDGNVVGADMYLAQHIADELGVELEIKPMEFSMAITAVDTGSADLVISGLGYTPERAENLELSNNYNGDGETSCHTLIVKSGDEVNFSSLEDFSGKSIGAQANSLQEMYVKDQIEGANIETFTTIDVGVLSLISGKYDAVAITCDGANGYANADENIAKTNVEFVMTAENSYDGYVMGTKKGETEFMEEVNAILAELEGTGKFEEWDEQAKALALELGIDLGE